MNELSDLDMMRRPDTWPHAWWLPVVGAGKRGFLWQGSMKTPAPAPEPVVYLSDPWSATGKVSDLPSQRYESLQAILEDGWRID